LNSKGNLPQWWFDSSFIILVVLAFSILIVIFDRPVREKIREIRLRRKKDSVARKYAPQFKDLVERSRVFSYSIRDLMDSLRNHYTNDIKSQLEKFSLQTSDQQKTDDIMFNVQKEIDKSAKSYRDLYLIMKRFESLLEMDKRNLQIIEVFVHEIMTTTDKPIAKGIEASFEAFREKYDDFIKDMIDFCHRINQESESEDFPERYFEYVKK